MILVSGGGVIADWGGRACSLIRGHHRPKTKTAHDQRPSQDQRPSKDQKAIVAFLLARALMVGLIFSSSALAQPGADRYQNSLSTSTTEIRGILAAENKATFTTDLNASVSKIAFREGDSFKKGDLLVAFDCRRQNAELKSLKAAFREMEVQLQGNIYLHRKGAADKRDLEVSRARSDRASHDARALEVRLERCAIKAPFDGRVSAIVIHEHETPPSGKPILEIIGTNKMELRLIVPSVWLVWLKEGTKFSFKVDETNTRYSAVVHRIGAAVDPVSQTINLTGKFLSPSPLVRAGMSGTATFPYHGE